METPSDLEANEAAKAIGRFLHEIGAAKAIALDVRKNSTFADAFVIATAASVAQLRGMQRRVVEQLSDLGLEPRRNPRRDDESGWILIDCYAVIVHLMLPDIREFYGLERLWFDADVLYEAPAPSVD